jgi:hypothetical protein
MAVMGPRQFTRGRGEDEAVGYRGRAEAEAAAKIPRQGEAEAGKPEDEARQGRRNTKLLSPM